ncbi:NeuD/PglB/VioB family sugar acetyltransferase [Pontibacter sp. E15-1]|uniref:NeuD/PglB/VioB family sugar acetyltransferase n=1 Tax=Pontibacter sp. E15-1 TaxID=2919918 RepID=UPI001F4F4EAD|nr:NeuD/PglB/VioB family sugar acetyltransferase [Pontibacter sp. E15-1]MCJ8164443.1 NeuD/PglB/VioB family sugar acetyltransferase [Pontibacter sp. E15-1]
MKKLLIIGCGNVGGFIANNLEEFTGERYAIEGFLDDDAQKCGKVLFGYPVLGSIDKISEYAAEVAVVVCVSNPRIRKNILDKLSAFSTISFPSFVSSHVWISNNIRIGKGVIIYPGVAINYNTSVADFSILNMNCAIGHDCRIGRCATLAPGVSLGGFTVLENCVEMGINAATVQGSRVGENSIVGGMGMVTQEIPANCTAVGVPAKPVKYHSDYVALKSVG